MDLKLFCMTFGIVFLAELGDKTQLTALALSSGKPTCWLTVFLGSSLALVCTSAIAAVGGSVIARYIPAKYLIATAAIFFIIMGCCMLINLACKCSSPPAA